MSRAAVIVAFAMALHPTIASAIPRAGTTAPAVTIENLDGKSRALPDQGVAVLVFFEDDKAGAQNQHVRNAIGPVLERPEARGRVELLAVADVGQWNFWPARGYALAALRDAEKKEKVKLWADWKAGVRKRWGFTPKKSGIILVAANGRVLFADEGPLSEARVAELLARLKEVVNGGT